MKSLYRFALLGCLALPGCLYAHVRGPLDTDLAVTKLGAKTGTSSAQSILGLVAWGDASSATAARNGGINTLNHMDFEEFVILGFIYQKHTTIVYGD